jgi:hypothetical protein
MEKPKRGRPKKLIDLEMVERLAGIQCTYSEIACTLKVSVDTLTRHKDCAAIFKRGAEGGRKSLRRMQFESANKGNVTMQIWLGKQYLGQSDHVTSEVRQLPSLRDVTSEELHELLIEYTRDSPELTAEVRALEAEYAAIPTYPRRLNPSNLAVASSSENERESDEES